MIKLVAEPTTLTFEVLDMRASGASLGEITLEELYGLLDGVKPAAVFDGEHEDLIRRHIRARDKGSTLFLEAIESVK